MIRTITTVAFAAALALTTGSALAGDHHVAVGESGSRQEILSLDGVDLNNPAEAKSFYRSLQYAAARVCVGESRACDKEAVSDAVRQIGSAELARLDNADAEATQMAAVRSETSQR